MGHASVFASTLAKIRDWQNTVAVLPLRHDIDVIEDLQRFAAEEQLRASCAVVAGVRGMTENDSSSRSES